MSKKVEHIAEKMMAKPYILNMGAGKLSRWFKATKDEIIEAKAIARSGIGLDVATINTQKTNHLPKILVLDIETAPIKAYVWRLWKQNVYIDQIVSDWFMLTWSAKWLFSTDVMSDALTGEEAINEYDERLVNNLWKLLDEADVVIAHNGNSFDIPRVNARFVKWGLKPTSPYQQIDTKIVAAKQFGFSSNKLEALARMFNIPGKIDTEFELWSRCLNGDQDALTEMEIYNRNDVVVLEEVYLRLRPWIKSHINLGLYNDGNKMICPNCGSEEIYEDGNYYYTPAGRYKTYRCKCGAVSRSRFNDVKAEEGKKIVVSVAR